MAAHRHDYTGVVDHEQAWRRLKSFGPDEVHRLSGIYQSHGRPLGEEAWPFGLWAAYQTWTTTN